MSVKSEYIVLGIESSCDDTAAAIVRKDNKGKHILSNFTFAQLEQHILYGGVVPEIASRNHIASIKTVIREALKEAECTIDSIDGIAVTSGPGLIGGLLVGTVVAKAISVVLGKPIIQVNHLEGHALTVRLTDEVEFPFMALLVSGGHCQILSVKGVGQYEVLGHTLDDALGETFDKVARMLGMPYPGGPHIEQAAKGGRIDAFNLPKPMFNHESANLSFSGLKTACRNIIQKTPELNVKDFCATFQNTIVKILLNRIAKAISISKIQHSTLVICGGVAANEYIRSSIITHLNESYNMRVVAPPTNLCTDNAAMIAWVGIERLTMGISDDIAFEPRSTWSLADLTGK